MLRPPNPVIHGYAIYQNDDLSGSYSSKDPLPAGIERVSRLLSGLLDAAVNYYEPAAFLTQRELNRELGRYANPMNVEQLLCEGDAYIKRHHLAAEKLPREMFLATAERLLLYYLREQREARYFLARARRDIGYLAESQWYWLLGYNSQYETVSFIHDFYEVECCPAGEFDVTRDVLLEQFGESESGRRYPWPMWNPAP